MTAAVGPQAGLATRTPLSGGLQHCGPPAIGEADAPYLQTSGSSTALGILEDHTRSGTNGSTAVAVEAAAPPAGRARQTITPAWWITAGD